MNQVTWVKRLLVSFFKWFIKWKGQHLIYLTRRVKGYLSLKTDNMTDSHTKSRKEIMRSKSFEALPSLPVFFYFWQTLLLTSCSCFISCVIPILFSLPSQSLLLLACPFKWHTQQHNSLSLSLPVSFFPVASSEVKCIFPFLIDFSKSPSCKAKLQMY